MKALFRTRLVDVVNGMIALLHGETQTEQEALVKQVADARADPSQLEKFLQIAKVKLEQAPVDEDLVEEEVEVKVDTPAPSPPPPPSSMYM